MPTPSNGLPKRTARRGVPTSGLLKGLICVLRCHEDAGTRVTPGHFELMRLPMARGLTLEAFVRPN